MSSKNVDHCILETQQWCSQESIQYRDTELRSPVIEPPLKLYEAFKFGNSAKTSLEKQIEQVDFVANSRRNSLTLNVSSKHLNGRFLAIDLACIMYDGIANLMTDGFFDDSDTPPWDMWICVVKVSEKTELTGHLLSWIPSNYYGITEVGIQASTGGCAYWLTSGNLSEKEIKNDILQMHKRR